MQPADRERRVVIVGVLIAMLLAAVDQASVAPAIAIIGADLGNSPFLSWVVSVYFVTATAVTTLYGKIADVHGRRVTLFGAIATFLVGSLISTTAPSLELLILGRAIQGLGGGGLLVLAQTVIGDVVPPAERGRYAAYISGAWAVASIAGPVLGGAIAEHVHWRAIFLLNMPLGFLAMAICWGPLKRLPWTKREHRLDVLGSVLVVSATVMAMLALTWSGPRHGWRAPDTLGLLAACALVTGWFIVHVRRAAEPLIPLSVLSNRTVAAATIGGFFVMAAYTGLAVFLPIYLQLVLGLSPSNAGLALIAYMAGAVIGSWIAGRALTRLTRYKLAAVAGLAAAVIALVLMTAWSGRMPLATFEALLLLAGAGLGANFPVTTVSVQNAVESHNLGAATGVLQFLRSLGSAIGIAVLGAAAAVFGIATGITARTPGAGGGPLSAAATGAAFAPLFALVAAGALIALCCIMMIENKPLRGR